MSQGQQGHEDAYANECTLEEVEQTEKKFQAAHGKTPIFVMQSHKQWHCRPHEMYFRLEQRNYNGKDIWALNFSSATTPT